MYMYMCTLVRIISTEVYIHVHIIVQGHTKSITCFSNRPATNIDPGGSNKNKNSKWISLKFLTKDSHYAIIVLRSLLSVRASGKWPEAIWLELKHFLSGHRWTSDITTGSPLTWLTMAQTATKLRQFQKDGGIELDWSVHLHEVAWGTQKSNVLESMLSTGTLRKEAILF
jgi:hypothetical protein